MLMSLEEVVQRIEQNEWLVLAGSEKVLEKLPIGHWIGGTIPYFIGQEGGEESDSKIFVQSLPANYEQATVRFYDTESIASIAIEAPDNGFTLLLIPASSQVHLDYAANAPEYDEMFLKPIAGWITGVHLDDLGKISPKVFNGETGEAREDQAIALHVSLPSHQMANIEIINLFEQGKGDIITFPNKGFSAADAFINGQPANLADYITQNNIDTKLPLVADYYGAMINVSFKNIDTTKRVTDFYAPIFEDIEYRLAAPIGDYQHEFQASVPADIEQITFSCNWILNYLYSDLKGKKTANITGPITFGEIAYQLLNQTLVYLNIEDV
jgi:hypothetical protein